MLIHYNHDKNHLIKYCIKLYASIHKYIHLLSRPHIHQGHRWVGANPSWPQVRGGTLGRSPIHHTHTSGGVQRSQLTEFTCLWTVGGNQRSSTQKDPNRWWGSNREPSRCEWTVIIIAPYRLYYVLNIKENN